MKKKNLSPERLKQIQNYIRVVGSHIKHLKIRILYYKQEMYSKLGTTQISKLEQDAFHKAFHDTVESHSLEFAQSSKGWQYRRDIQWSYPEMRTIRHYRDLFFPICKTLNKYQNKIHHFKTLIENENNRSSNG